MAAASTSLWKRAKIRVREPPVFLISIARCWDIKGALILLLKTANCVPRQPLSHEM